MKNEAKYQYIIHLSGAIVTDKALSTATDAEVQKFVAENLDHSSSALHLEWVTDVTDRPTVQVYPNGLSWPAIKEDH